MDDIVKLTIDGEEIEARKGMTVLKAAEENGIFIPTLCAAADLSPRGACRVCVVEIDGIRGLPTSCTTPVAEGMVVRTESDVLEKARKLAIELIRSDHPIDCNACPKNNQCDFQMAEMIAGITSIRFPSIPKDIPLDTSNPFFQIDRNYCILCTKCVRACTEIAGIENLTVAGMGYNRHVSTFGDKPLVESNCVSCGACLDHCPVYTLTPVDTKKAEEQFPGICSYCAAGCGINLGARHDSVVVTTGREEGTVNEGTLCVRGRFGIADFINSSERLTTPLIKKDGKLVEAEWDEAIALAAEKLGAYKGDNVAIIPSNKCSNEDTYVLQKFGRVVLGTNNVSHYGKLMQGEGDGLAKALGSGATTNPMSEIVDSSCILTIGVNTASDNPHIGKKIKKAVRSGAKLIVANPRETDMVRHSDLWLRYKAGTEVALLMGIMKAAIDEGLADKAFIEEKCDNYDEFVKSLEIFDLESAEKATGVPAADIKAAAQLFAGNNPSAIVYDAGTEIDVIGSAVADLAMLTGNIGKASAGIYALLKETNEQGACDMGALPDFLPGYQSISDAEAKQKFEEAWGCTLSDKPGLTPSQVIEAAGQGQIKAMYVVGENPVLKGDTKQTQEALSKLEFLVVQDLFLSETAQMADVVLPACSFAEKDGTVTNTERRIQLGKKGADAAGKSKPDWMITCQIAQKMGVEGFDFTKTLKIIKEMASLVPAYGGISLSRLSGGGFQWPCPSSDSEGTPVLHTEDFKGHFVPLTPDSSIEATDNEYPLILMTGQSMYHFDTGTRTRKVNGLNVLRGEDMVEVSPSDAQAIGLSDGDSVKVASRQAEVTVKAQITDATPEGTVFITCNFPGNSIKSSAVKIEKAA